MISIRTCWFVGAVVCCELLSHAALVTALANGFTTNTNPIMDLFAKITGDNSSSKGGLVAPTSEMLESTHLLILPGFGNAMNDYTMDDSLVPVLRSRGWGKGNISVLPVERGDWLKVFVRGCFDIKFWQSDAAPTRAAFRWYLEKVASEVKIIKDRCGDDTKIVLVGHSAGGWLARASIGYGTTEVYPERKEFDSAVQVDKKDIFGVVTLGAPNLSPPEGLMDMTRGALRITNELFPAAFHLPNGLFYVTVGGLAVTGEEQVRTTPFERTSVTGFAFNSYEAVCGNGSATGDGVVPIESSHLDDAIQLTLDNCFHSINALDNWYGSDLFIDKWHSLMLDELDARM